MIHYFFLIINILLIQISFSLLFHNNILHRNKQLQQYKRSNTYLYSSFNDDKNDDYISLWREKVEYVDLAMVYIYI